VLSLQSTSLAHRYQLCASEGPDQNWPGQAAHAAGLLAEAELHALEDCVADFIALRSSGGGGAQQLDAAAERVRGLVGLSEGLRGDAAFARQARRKIA
jgi:hypothetical protein